MLLVLIATNGSFSLTAPYFLKLRVQENSEEIPAGCMPRSIDCVVRDELTEKFFINLELNQAIDVYLQAH